MIVGDLKPLPEIIEMIAKYNRILVLGCGGCVSVCQTGGAREAETLSQLLKIEGKDAHWLTTPRQCEWEFLDPIAEETTKYEVIISIACGVGIQAMNEKFPAIQTLPGMNTRFLGMPVKHGVFEERCQACGNCVLHLTGGICPVARCSKNLMNGPCGGSQNGRCEISPEISCAWHLIYERLKAIGKLDLLLQPQPARDWSFARDGGPRKMIREDLLLDGE
ncbi:MAG: methylenetetrahydrofolate reductase C-terminal domain-containing protein [Chitinophagales bacterium]